MRGPMFKTQWKHNLAGFVQDPVRWTLLVGPTVTRLVQDPLAVLRLEN